MNKENSNIIIDKELEFELKNNSNIKAIFLIIYY
jgi:hypothetical protein